MFIKKKTLYKVLSVDSFGELHSACRNFSSVFADYVLDFKKGKVTKPKIKGSKIYCFGSLMKAHEWQRNMTDQYGGTFTIYSVLGMGVSTHEKYTPVSVNTPTKIRDFWEKLNFTKRLKQAFVDYFSRTTLEDWYACDSVKLLECMAE